MIAKYIFIVLSAVLFLQIPDTLSTVQLRSPDDIRELISAHIHSNNELPDEVSENAVNNLLRFLQIILTNKISGELVRDASTKTRILLTSDLSTKNIEMIVETIGFLLRNPNSSQIIMDVCDEITNIINNEGDVRPVFEAMSRQFKRILAEPKALETVRALIDGVNLMLNDIKPEQIPAGVKRLSNLISLANRFSSPKVSPTPTSKTFDSQSMARANLLKQPASRLSKGPSSSSGTLDVRSLPTFERSTISQFAVDDSNPEYLYNFF